MAEETAAGMPARDDTQPALPSGAGLRTDQAISGWFAEHINNSPVSRSTEAFNHLLSVLAHLKAELEKEV